MKGRFAVLCILMLVILIAPVAILRFREDYKIAYLDATEVNALIHDCADRWDDINSNASEGNARTASIYGFEYEVMDNDGNIVLYTQHDMPKDLGRATTLRYTIRDIIKDGEVVGKLLIANDYEHIKSDAYVSYRMRYLVCVLVEAVIIALFLVWVYFYIVRPFDRMKDFAADVASGDLDAPLTMDRGNLFGAFTESFDIMRIELADARQKEYEAQRSKVELVAQLSHDIKTPVASIKAMGELLGAVNTDPKQKTKLDSIVGKADQIDVLVSDLFATSLTDLDQLEVNCSEQESRVLDKIIKEADHNEYVVGGEVTECLIVCDPVRTTQVINNIIHNSYKYADTSIYLDSRTEGDSLILSLTDRGGGVSEEDLPMVTKKFRRGANAKEKQGAGLGLAIASELMEKMGGSLECSNADGGFRVTLQFRLADSSEEE